jgi:peptidoglycan/LPS O-acetylase OafA/YrhL
VQLKERTAADERYPALDGLRAFAVGLVLLMHATYGQFRGGFIGVDIFFVLSGFLITSSLITEYRFSGRVSLGRFWLRRARRLLPAFAVMLTLSWFLWRYFVPPAPPFARAAGAALLYVANIQAVVDPSKLGALLHTWSLSTEEQFYLFWPLFASVVLKAGRPAPLLVIALVAAIARAALFYLGSPAASYFSPLCRVDQLLIGCSLAVGIGSVPRASKAVRLAALALLVALVPLVLQTDNAWPPYYYGAMSAVAIGAACLIAALRDGSWWLSRIFSLAPFAWVGKRSYGIYLFHFPIFALLDQFRTRHSLANFAVVTIARFGIAISVAALSWNFVERPLMKARRLPPRASRLMKEE